MIVEDMRNVDVLGKPEEWFVPWDPNKEGIDWPSQIGGVKKRASSDNGVCSIKVMANQLAKVDRCLSGQEVPSRHLQNFHLFFSDAKWVFIRRRDVVAQAVSRLMARQTGINHATGAKNDEHFAGNLMKGYKTDYNEKAKYNYEEIFVEVNSIVLENIVWSKFFEVHDIHPLQLEYEIVSKDPDMSHIAAIADLIELPHPAVIERKMVKVGNEKNKEWIERFYHEVASRSFKA